MAHRNAVRGEIGLRRIKYRRDLTSPAHLVTALVRICLTQIADRLVPPVL